MSNELISPKTDEEGSKALLAIKEDNAEEMKNIELQTVDDKSEPIRIFSNTETDRFVKENGNLPIHHVMKIDHFMNLVGVCGAKSGTNFLQKLPGTWKDINEAFYYKQRFHLNTGEEVSLETWLNSLYGQSWSLNDESESCYMWELYGGDHPDNLVQVTTTVSQLWNSIVSIGQDHSLFRSKRVTIRLGRVGYVPLPVFTSSINRNIDQLPIGHDLFDLVLKSVFLKTSQYQFEREVRLVASFESQDGRPPDDLPEKGLAYSLVPESFINRVTASPFMSDERFENVRRELESRSANLLSKYRKSELFVRPSPVNTTTYELAKECERILAEQDDVTDGNDHLGSHQNSPL